VSTLALIGASIEKIATEIRTLQRPEIRELEEPFGSGQKGSSAMPHKRNPVQCEQLTGLARVLRGHALTAMENVALWSERDISHSSAERVILPDACILVHYMLSKLNKILGGLTVNGERMRANLDVTRGLIYSQKILLRLVDEGLTREDAYAAVQAAAMRTWHGQNHFVDELLVEKAVTGRFDREKLLGWFDPQSYLGEVDAIFARCGLPL
jgi:adenylosuccinate lyase